MRIPPENDRIRSPPPPPNPESETPPPSQAPVQDATGNFVRGQHHGVLRPRPGRGELRVVRKDAEWKAPSQGAQPRGPTVQIAQWTLFEALAKLSPTTVDRAVEKATRPHSWTLRIPLTLTPCGDSCHSENGAVRRFHPPCHKPIRRTVPPSDQDEDEASASCGKHITRLVDRARRGPFTGHLERFP